MGASVGAGSLAPQAAIDRTMTRASSIAISFFIVFSSIFVLLSAEKPLIYEF